MVFHIGVTEFRNQSVYNREFMETQQVHNADPSNSRPEKFWSLINASCNQ